MVFQARALGLFRNNLDVLHLIFGASLAAPQSQNPRRSPATPAVLLNRRAQIRPKSERNFAQVISEQALCRSLLIVVASMTSIFAEIFCRSVLAVPRQIRLIAAALLWTIVGLVLVCRGGFLLAAAPVSYLVAALSLGLVKAPILMRVADKNIQRLSRQPDRICMGGMYSWKVWALVVAMILFGGALRRLLSPVVAGVVLFAVGVALLSGSMRIWRHLSSVRG